MKNQKIDTLALLDDATEEFFREKHAQNILAYGNAVRNLVGNISYELGDDDFIAAERSFRRYGNMRPIKNAPANSKT